MKHENSTDTRVYTRIRAHDAGWVFTPDEFADLGTSQAVRHALSRYEKEGRIRRLTRGLYHLPRVHPKLGELAPSPDSIAKAFQFRDGGRLQPTGAYAANLLGLSEQVPAKIIFYTDGRARTINLKHQQILLKKRSSRAMATAGTISGLVFHALEYLGKEHVTEETIQKLKRKLSPKDIKQLLSDVRYAPDWVADIIRKLNAIG